jgi:hypothetical protein
MKRPVPPPLPQDDLSYEAKIEAKLAERKRQDRKDLFWEVFLRIMIGGGCAAIAWYSFTGSYVFDKGLASLTLGDIGSLVFAGMFAVAAFRILTGEDRT